MLFNLISDFNKKNMFLKAFFGGLEQLFQMREIENFNILMRVVDRNFKAYF